MRFDISITYDFTPEVCYWLQKGIDKTPYCTETIESVEKAVRFNQGCVYTIKHNEELYGVVVTGFVKGFPKNFLSVFLVSGKKMDLWHEQLWKTLKEIANFLEARIVITGRKGWKKIVPELKEVGVVFIYE